MLPSRAALSLPVQVVSKQAMYLCGASESCGQTARISDACQCSANQAHLFAVTIQPSMPMRSPSARASAAAKQCSSGFWRSMRRRSWAKQVKSHCSASLLSGRRCNSARCGSAMRIHVPFCAEMTFGKSALHVISCDPARITWALKGSHKPGGCSATRAELSSVFRKVCHMRGWISFRVPAALRRSLYSGAIYGRRCGQVLVAHISKPSVASSSLRCTFLEWHSVCSWRRSFASLACDRRRISNAKEKFQPHQTTSVLSCAFFQEIGALIHARKASSRHTGRAHCCFCRSVRRSSTYSHMRRGASASRSCAVRVSNAPSRDHQ